ncbi:MULTISPECIES: hypothetical protein [Pseudomonas syringae group]|uniref:Uncharacterized protein n=3 Tax=Pseudomonas amygdali TaxID=47877 RepID=A0A0P9Q9L9_PSEA0|nr:MULTISPECIES: hypothetical protein [Pseudomonas syringae group]AVB15032.1 hypothetical protein BKM19_016700 [Pseudomonas amygdali pv. morsprunorum]KPX27394.1 Uncharacterized protein ALO70_02363 [Pseudomonas amygdali pv. eriobotryae]KWS50236.1 hypothetical protein AL056_14935 [Pseudomonas amygdali pv. morsprunorum]KWS59619.1 hypothetical protein AL054_09975 [Pseudomonas amygdali pv. morsprunorum]KWS74879.1 hypothetical protein AL052_09870 [Pseudomonas amygdali pv. eriobotryae]
MIIKLAPQRRDDAFVVEKNGAVLIINGEAFDFSPMSAGSTLPRSAIVSEWFAGDVEYENDLTIHIIMPVPANYSPEQAYPADLIEVPDGIVQFPKPLPPVPPPVFGMNEGVE